MSPTDYWRVVAPGICLCCCCDRFPPVTTFEPDSDMKDDVSVANGKLSMLNITPIEDHFHLCFEDSDEEKGDSPNFPDALDLSYDLGPTPFDIDSKDVRPKPDIEKKGAGAAPSSPQLRVPPARRLQSFVAGNRLSLPRQYYRDILKFSAETSNDPELMRQRAQSLRTRKILRVDVREHRRTVRPRPRGAMLEQVGEVNVDPFREISEPIVD